MTAPTKLCGMGRAIELARNRLVEWRVQRGETQKAAGSVVDWDQATMSKFELGKQPASVDQLYVLASHYGKSLSDLFGDLPPTEPDPPLKEWIDFYWRMSEEGRKAQLQAWRLTVPKSTRPSGAARRSVKREHESGASRLRGKPTATVGLSRKPDIRKRKEKHDDQP